VWRGRFGRGWEGARASLQHSPSPPRPKRPRHTRALLRMTGRPWSTILWLPSSHPSSDALHAPEERGERLPQGGSLAAALNPAGPVLRWLLLVLYIAVVGFVAAHHEPWRDEADSWLLCRDAPIGDIGPILARGGTPPLWYAILYPFARVGFPYATEQVINVLVMIAAAAMLLWRSPFPVVTSVLLLFSYYVAYEYAVIARSYSLSVLLLFAIAAAYGQRLTRPVAFGSLLALLANANPHSFFIAAAIAAVWLWESWSARGRGATLEWGAAASAASGRGHPPSRIAGPVIAVAGLLIAAAFLVPRSDAQQSGRVHSLRLQPLLDAVGQAFVPYTPNALAIVIGLAIIAAMLLAIRRNRRALLLTIGGLAGLSFIYSFVWVGGYRHYGFLLLLVVVSLWITARGGVAAEQKARTAALVLLTTSLAISTISAAMHWKLDVAEAFSGAKEMGQYMTTNHLDRLPVAAHNSTQCEAVLPYLTSRTFWYAGTGRDGSYMTWDRELERGLDTPYPVAERRALQHFAGRDFLLLFNVEMPDPAAHGFRLLYETRRPIFEKTDEHYWLYRSLPH
jgi:hypothetical protein